MSATQFALQLHNHDNPSGLLPQLKPYYLTPSGAAYRSDARDILQALPTGSINAIITSPPYALHFQKEYGNVKKDEYVPWFLDFAKEMYRVLADDGSLVLNIGGSYNPKLPTRSLYHFKLLISLVEEIGFHLAQECFWYNPAKMPMPAEWVTVRRIRIRDSVEYVWWLSKTPWPRANNRNVLREYSPDMQRLNKRGLEKTKRPGGYEIKPTWSEMDAGGSIPPNVFEDEQITEISEYATDLLKFGNNAANDKYTLRCKEAGIKPHPARFPKALPEFFMKLLTNEGDVIIDPFAGSNTTGAVAELNGRRWIAIEMLEEYLSASRFRFDEVPPLS